MKKMKLVFTNGCFDILHPGHIDLLQRARALGDKLVVGLNSDSSIRRIKGPNRPYFDEQSRKVMLLGLRGVDEVHIYQEHTPDNLIQRLRPDVLVKGGDWKIEEIVGGAFVRSYGGEVLSLPLIDGYSTTTLIEKLGEVAKPDSISRILQDEMRNSTIPERSMAEHLETLGLVAGSLLKNIEAAGTRLVDTFARGNKILICGNGGSAADAQHIAAEFVGRFEKERPSLPAIALNTDTSALTAISNDYSFDRIFSRQVESLANSGDCLIAISTSGNSPNVIAAVMEARNKGCSVIGMTGSGGKKLAALSDEAFMIPSKRTARIQEAHITIAHILCEIVDDAVGSDWKSLN